MGRPSLASTACARPPRARRALPSARRHTRAHFQSRSAACTRSTWSRGARPSRSPQSQARRTGRSRSRERPRLVHAVRPARDGQHAAGARVHDADLAVTHDVVHVALEERARAQRVEHVRAPGRALLLPQVRQRRRAPLRLGAREARPGLLCAASTRVTHTARPRAWRPPRGALAQRTHRRRTPHSHRGAAALEPETGAAHAHPTRAHRAAACGRGRAAYAVCAAPAPCRAA